MQITDSVAGSWSVTMSRIGLVAVLKAERVHVALGERLQGFSCSSVHGWTSSRAGASKLALTREPFALMPAAAHAPSVAAPTCSIGRVSSSLRSLPLPLAVWSRIGRHCTVRTRLNVSWRLGRAFLSDGTLYQGRDGFVFGIDRGDAFQVMMLLGIYDPVVERILRQFTTAGGIAIDVGAHLGYFSLRLARMVGPKGTVHSFECDPRLVPRLKNHVDLNCLRQVEVNDCGVLDRELEAAQLFLPRHLGWASVREIPWRTIESVTVRMVTLDGYAAENGIDPERLSVIKLDAEGAELGALRGASRLLRATAAAVLVEYVPRRMRELGDDPGELLALMAEAGYQPWAPVRMVRGRVRLVRGTEAAIGEDILFLKSARTSN